MQGHIQYDTKDVIFINLTAVDVKKLTVVDVIINYV